ncbi:GGDEF domain-containing protein [Rhodoferax sp.]|uniref:GGDEF domain-containing protein n=1 Tax=Rhodoferax sp. TaxID=50421 RepID=UPI0026009D95|nr:GGDEF domain-containing protein [Rhodoferax sp.]
MTSLIQELAKTELLSNLPEAILVQVAGHATPQLLAAGEVLLTPDEDNAHVYLVLSGALEIHFESLDSPAIREVAPGGSVGEMSVIDDTRPSAYVVAKVPSRVFKIHRDLIQDMVADSHSVAGNLLRLLTRWLKENTHRIVRDRWQIQELTDHVDVDALTGLYNRRWLDNAIGRLLEQSVKAQKGLGVLLIDADHFKQYNDTHGHQGGDQALVALSNVLKTTVRPYDFATRYGGEEFLVLLPNTTLPEAISTAQRISDATRAAPVVSPSGDKLPGITVSIGVAVSDAFSTPQALVAAADSRLYAAKNAGRNCVRF